MQCQKCKKINSIFSESLLLQKSESPTSGEGQEVPVPVESESGNSHHDEVWKLMIPPTSTKASTLHPDLQLQNKLTAFAADEDLGMMLNGASQKSEPEPDISGRRQQLSDSGGRLLSAVDRDIHLLT